MSAEDRAKWDLRYQEGAYSGRSYPSEFLVEETASLYSSGKALDLACGSGRNALYLASQGFRVDAMDVSTVGLELAAEKSNGLGLTINWLNRDLLESPDLPENYYDLIVMFRFVAPELLAGLSKSLVGGGSLIIEEHLEWSTKDVGGPSGNRFRVSPNYLRNACHGMDLLNYSEGLVKEPDGTTSALARAHAKKRLKVK